MPFKGRTMPCFIYEIRGVVSDLVKFQFEHPRVLPRHEHRHVWCRLKHKSLCTVFVDTDLLDVTPVAVEVHPGAACDYTKDFELEY